MSEIEVKIRDDKAMLYTPYNPDQRGYKIFHNDKELSSKKDVNKVLDKMEDADNYMIEANDKNKTLNIIDP